MLVIKLGACPMVYLPNEKSTPCVLHDITVSPTSTPSEDEKKEITGSGSSSKGLSPAVTAIIVVVVVISAIATAAIFLAAFFYYRKNYNQRRNDDRNSNQSNNNSSSNYASTDISLANGSESGSLEDDAASISISMADLNSNEHLKALEGKQLIDELIHLSLRVLSSSYLRTDDCYIIFYALQQSLISSLIWRILLLGRN